MAADPQSASWPSGTFGRIYLRAQVN